MLRIRLVIPLLVLALVVTGAWSQQANRPATEEDLAAKADSEVSSYLHPSALIMPMRGTNLRQAPGAASTSVSNPQNMMYFGGAVFPKATTYALWWGNPEDFAPDERDRIGDILQSGFEGSDYLAIADQYLFGRKAQTHFGGNFFDHSTPPSQDPPTSEIVTEVYNVLRNRGQKPDPAALYMVFTSNFPNENYYCAFHDYGIGLDGTPIHIIFIPNSNNQPLCWVQPPELSCNNHSNGLQAGANSMAHELMESITDPNHDAWYNSVFNDEIGDPCNFTYQRCVTLANETTWQLQMIWSNRTGACVQGAGASE